MVTMYKCKQAALLAEVINTNSAHQQALLKTIFYWQL